jgi:transposase InsO family protein
MPFDERTISMNRDDFVKEWEANADTKSALCRKYGISRPTGDLWIARSLAGKSMEDGSHAPLSRPNKTPLEMVKRILEMRAAEPALGASKIKRMLENAGVIDVPCMATINTILKAHGLITLEASQAATPYLRFARKQPNELWQCDFKGHYATLDGVRVHPLSLMDDCSRFCLNADAKLDERFPGVKASFIVVFRENGIPWAVLCDHGNPWGNSQIVGYTAFEVWLMELGILVIHIRPRHPQTQGKVERFNGCFKQERLKLHIPLNFADAIAQRLAYREFYNNRRPHHALGLDTPAQHYRPSERAYPERVHEWEYEEGYSLLRVKASGYFSHNGKTYFLGEAFGGKQIALRPSSREDGAWNLFFREFRIGRLNEKEKSLVSRTIYRIKNDPRNQPPETPKPD